MIAFVVVVVVFFFFMRRGLNVSCIYIVGLHASLSQFI